MQNSKNFRGTKPRTFVLGEVCFRSPKMYWNSNSNAEFKHFSRGQYSGVRTPVLGWKKFVLVLPEMYQTSPTAMQNSKIFRGTIPRTPVLTFKGEEKLFSFTKNILELFYSNAEFNIFLGTIPRTPVLGKRKDCFRSPKMYQISDTAKQNSYKIPGVEPSDLGFRVWRWMKLPPFEIMSGYATAYIIDHRDIMHKRWIFCQQITWCDPNRPTIIDLKLFLTTKFAPTTFQLSSTLTAADRNRGTKSTSWWTTAICALGLYLEGT